MRLRSACLLLIGSLALLTLGCPSEDDGVSVVSKKTGNGTTASSPTAKPSGLFGGITDVAAATPTPNPNGSSATPTPKPSPTLRDLPAPGGGATVPPASVPTPTPDPFAGASTPTP